MKCAIPIRVLRRFRPSVAAEDGQALVEFALILPLLMLVVAMVLEFGKAFHHWQDENHLANLAARLASVDSKPGSDTLQSYVLSQSDTPELKNGGTDSVADPAKVCIDFPDGSAVGKPVKATVTVTYKWMPILGGVASSTLTGSATMRMERPATKYSEGCSS